MDTTATTNATTQTPAAENTAAEQQQTAAPETASSTEAEQQESPKAEDIEKMIQRAVDRATNKLGNENKKLKADLDAEKKKNLSAEEVRKLELQEKEDAIAERERALTEKENRLIAIKAIKEAGLDDGSDASLAIVDFVMAEDEDGIKERVKTFNALVDRIVKAKVDGVFKSNGRTPGVGTDSAGSQTDSFAARMGKNTASANKAAQSVRDHYIGGNK